MPLLPNCREVTRLVLEGEDRQLPWPDRVRIRLHLSVCQACTNFTGQVRLMRRAMNQWRRYGSDDASGAEPPPRNGPARE
ncbi:MAG: zf-HC2 domain-containing protein [Leptothrix sp. (in: b-proteobacteria)]